MDTSIIVVIAIVVVFAVAVPAMIRKSATELSRAEIDTVPDNAAVVSATTPNPGHDHSVRTQVFRDKPRKTPSVPLPDVSHTEAAPQLSLSSTPEFSVIDGQAETTTIAEAADESQLHVMPIAVGETRSAYPAEHGVAGQGGATGQPAVANKGSAAGQSGVGNVRMLHPAVHAVFNDSAPGSGSQGGPQSDPQAGPSRPAQMHPPHAQSPTARGRSASGPAGRGGASRTGGPGASRGDRLGNDAQKTDAPQMSNPNVGDDEEHAMTEQATTLRESLKSLNTMVRGFALVFLASMLGILVTSVLALFSVVHIALAGVFLGLAVVSLFLVRTLNLRKAEVKKKLRRLDRSPQRSAKTVPVKTQQSHAAGSAQATAAASVDAQPAGNARQSSAATRQSAPSGQQPAQAARQSAPSTQQPGPAARPSGSERTTARTHTAARPASSASTSSGTAARIAAAAQAKNGSTKAARARAAMTHSTEAKKAREEADTGEIPLVRVRKEASEGHTTRQVLLTGPIPVVKEDAPAEAAGDAAEATTASSAESTVGSSVASSADPTAGSSVEADSTTESPAEKDATEAPVALGADLVADAPAAESGQNSADSDVHAALNAAAPKVDDPFMQRLKSRDGWSPTPLPVPSYVGAPEAEHQVPSATAADASSYETEARSREDIAAQFAAELGYRPELSDSAREEGPLGHGRKAIRTNKAADLGAVNDVLARRRA
ncbi:hypothetical protein [Brevibacterium atlanticum]|uniref:hypothetical protein n=1 Tax=Brevibacterium atlanticum TaxID=2697563 RepID=UPI00141F906E|nr:hypothetical protein [Brevibacterium atlanticum]